MSAIWIKTFALVAVLSGGSLLFGQGGPQPGPQNPPVGKTADQAPARSDKEVLPKTKLEEMIQQAMRNNADIRVAETKVAEAEAELNRTRQVVVQKVVLYSANLDLAKAVVAEAEQRVRNMREAISKVPGAYSKEDLQGMEATLLSKKAELAKVEAELPLLLGTPAHAAATDKAIDKGVEWLRRASLDLYGDPNRWQEAQVELDRATAVDQWMKQIGSRDASNTTHFLEALYAAGVKPPVQGPMAERIKKALDKEVVVNFSMTPLDILEHLQQKYFEDVPFKIQLKDEQMAPGQIDLTLGRPVPLGAVMQAFQDSALPSVRFVVRDYGILVTDDKHVPPGAPLLYDVWKGGKETKAAKAADRIEGKVKAVDDKAKLVAIDIGSDAGLKKGDTLEVYRMDHPNAPKYAGQLKVVEVKPTDAVAGSFSGVKDDAPKVGDSVTNRLHEK